MTVHQPISNYLTLYYSEFNPTVAADLRVGRLQNSADSGVGRYAWIDTAAASPA